MDPKSKPPVTPVPSIPKTDSPVHSWSEDTTIKPNRAKLVILGIYGILILVGVSTGYILATSGAVKSQAVGTSSESEEAPPKVVGVQDEKTFKDSAEGTLQAGGLNGEGTHKLEREGGPSQTVYLTSSVIDMDEYAGKKVKIWGQTMAAQEAAWLMDVGRLEVVE